MKLLRRNIVMAFLLLLTFSLLAFMIQALWRDMLNPFLSVKTWRYIISGAFMQGPFDIRNAGTCFDQPTIGKYLYLFSITAFLSSASLVLARMRFSSSSFWQQGIFILFATISTFLTLTLLLIPTCLLLHYVFAMGMTTRRLLGLLYSAGAWIVLPCFAFAACRKQWNRSWLFVVTAWGALLIPILFPSYLALDLIYIHIRRGQFGSLFDVLGLIFLGVWLAFCMLAGYLCRWVYIERKRATARRDTVALPIWDELAG
jgi:hypothetical protein